MKTRLGGFLALLALVAPFGLVACGSGDDESSKAGKEACGIYRDALKDNPEAVADIATLGEIKGMLSDLDAPTKRAFAALLTAADANPFTPGADPNAVRDAATEVRTVCLAEHDVEINA